jgi:hypothetical protein
MIALQIGLNCFGYCCSKVCFLKSVLSRSVFPVTVVFTPWSLLCIQIRYPRGSETVVLEPWGPAVTFR